LHRCSGSSPIAAAATKRLFQIFFGIVSGYLFYQNVEAVQNISNYALNEYKQVSIFPIILRDGSNPGFNPSFSEFGLLKNRCMIPPTGQLWTNGTLFQVLFLAGLFCFALH
jgi:hypothetical protein